MKKIFLLGLMCLMGFMGAQAQFSDYGVKLGVGMATIEDDLSTKSPVLGLNAGGYINFTFAQSESVLAEIFYLQTGLNIIHRGSNFEEIHEHENDLMVRTGFYHALYAQIPILAGVHLELPIRKAGHVVGFYLGPAVSVGLFGRYADRKVTPGNPAASANYDVNVTGTSTDRDVFSHINRLDIGAIVGLSHEYRNFTFSLFIDHGFMATSEGEDVLQLIENSQSGNTDNSKVRIPNGHNNAVMFSVAYRLGSFSK